MAVTVTLVEPSLGEAVKLSTPDFDSLKPPAPPPPPAFDPPPPPPPTTR